MLDGYEGLVQGLEHIDARPQERVIVVLRPSKALDEAPNRRRFRLVVLGVLEVEIVNDAADVAGRWIGDREPVAGAAQAALEDQDRTSWRLSAAATSSAIIAPVCWSSCESSFQLSLLC